MTITVPSSGLFSINVTAPTGIGVPLFSSGLSIDSLGRETISGVDIDLTQEPFASQNTGGALTSLTLGTRTVGSDHFTLSGTTLTTSATTSDATYTWTGCTATNADGTSDPFDLTITTLADQRTWSDPLAVSDEFFAWAERGKTVTLLGGHYKGTLFKPQALAVAFDGSNHIVIKPYPGATVTGENWEVGHASNNLGTMRVTGIEFIGDPVATSTPVLETGADDCIIENFTVRGRDTVTGFTDSETFTDRKLFALNGARCQALNGTIEDGTTGLFPAAEDGLIENVTIRRTAIDAFMAGRAKGLTIRNLTILEKLIFVRRTRIIAVNTGTQTTITLEAGHPFSTTVTERGQVHYVTGGDDFQNRIVDLEWVSGDTYRVVNKDTGLDYDTSAATIGDISAAYLYGSPVGEDFLHGDYGQLQSQMIADDQHDGLFVEGWFGGRS